MPESTSSPLLILHWPAPILGRKATPIETFDDALRSFAEAMIEVMYEAEGVGLAAPQVGASIRLFVADPREGDALDPVVFINPTLELEGDWISEEEGCLSIPDVRVHVRRPTVSTIRAFDLDGNPFELQSDTLAARVWQHETDHLDGVLIIDRMSPLDRLATRKALKELRSAAEEFDFDL